MLTTCSEPGCATLVMGGRCIEHERPATRVFVRGRPLVRAYGPNQAVAYGTGPLATTGARTFDALTGAPLDLTPSRN